MSSLLEFGTCPCGGSIELRYVEVRFAQAVPEPVLLAEVPQGACPNCGSRYYKATVLRVLEDEMRRVTPATAPGGELSPQ